MHLLLHPRPSPFPLLSFPFSPLLSSTRPLNSSPLLVSTRPLNSSPLLVSTRLLNSSPLLLSTRPLNSSFPLLLFTSLLSSTHFTPLFPLPISSPLFPFLPPPPFQFTSPLHFPSTLLFFLQISFHCHPISFHHTTSNLLSLLSYDSFSSTYQRGSSHPC